jgi:hypothetical protein
MHYDKIVVPKEITETVNNTLLAQAKKLSEGVNAYANENHQSILNAKVI